MNIEWAIKSKIIGDREDYRILACSKRIPKEEYDKFLRQHSVGDIPESESQLDAPAPWISFAPFNTQSGRYFSVIKQEWLTYSDASMRRVAAITCICISHEDILQLKNSLFDIYQIIDTLIKPSEKVALIKEQNDIKFNLDSVSCDLKVNSSITESINQDIEEKFKKYALTASLLLQDPVSLIVGPNSLKWEERLFEIEKIYALLPYETRFSIPACIWARGTTAHKMKLSFSTNARADQIKINWAQEKVEKQIPLTNYAQEYFDMLNLLHDGEGSKHILSYLETGINSSLNLENPQNIVDYLTNLHPAYIYYMRVMRIKDWNDNTRNEICRYLDSAFFDTLPAQEKDKLLTRLLQGLRNSEIKIVKNHLSEGVLIYANNLFVAEFFNHQQHNREWMGNIAELFRQVNKANALLKDLFKKLESQSSETQQVLFIRFFETILSNDIAEQKRDSMEKLLDIRLTPNQIYTWLRLFKGSKIPQAFLYYLRNSKYETPSIILLKAALLQEKEVSKSLTKKSFDEAFEVDYGLPYYLFHLSINHQNSGKILKPFTNWFLDLDFSKRQNINSGLENMLDEIYKKGTKLSWENYAQIDALRLSMRKTQNLYLENLGTGSRTRRGSEIYAQELIRLINLNNTSGIIIKSTIKSLKSGFLKTLFGNSNYEWIQDTVLESKISHKEITEEETGDHHKSKSEDHVSSFLEQEYGQTLRGENVLPSNIGKIADEIAELLQKGKITLADLNVFLENLSINTFTTEIDKKILLHLNDWAGNLKDINVYIDYVEDRYYQALKYVSQNTNDVSVIKYKSQIGFQIQNARMWKNRYK